MPILPWSWTITKPIDSTIDEDTKEGDYKIIGNFYYFVANGLNAKVGKWHSQVVDLRELYMEIGGVGEPVLTVLGFFCDSDNTAAESAALF